jgi:hypothetical protein
MREAWEHSDKSILMHYVITALIVVHDSFVAVK